MRRPQKVVAYIVHNGRLLVFWHVDDVDRDHAGLQVPVGTVHDGELPEVAVLREAREETGLERLRIVRYLGVGGYDTRPYADTIQVRHFFELAIDGGQVAERWRWYERGDGDITPIPLELFWIPLTQAHVVAAGQAAFVGRMFD